MLKILNENKIIAIVELLKNKWYVYWYDSVERLKAKKVNCILINNDKKEELISKHNPIIATISDLSGRDFCEKRDKKIFDILHNL